MDATQLVSKHVRVLNALKLLRSDWVSSVGSQQFEPIEHPRLLAHQLGSIRLLVTFVLLFTQAGAGARRTPAAEIGLGFLSLVSVAGVRRAPAFACPPAV